MEKADPVIRWIRGLSVRRVAIAIALAITVLMALGTVNRLAPSVALDAFSLDRPLSPIALLSGALLLGAAGIALLLRRVSPSSAWSVAAAALAVTGFAVLAAGHERLEQRLEAQLAMVWLPIAAAATVVLVIVAYLLRAQRGPAAMIAAGGVAWLCAQPLEGALGDPSLGESVARSTLEAGGGGLVALGLLSFLRRRLAAQPGLAASPPIGSRELTIALARRSSPARIAAWVAAVIVVLAVLGAVEGGTGVEAYLVNLRFNYTVPAVFSAGLLLVAGWLAFTFGTLMGRERLGWWGALAGVLVFLAMVEYAGVDRMVQRVIDVDPRQLLLTPVVALGVAAWAVALVRLAAWRDAAWMWIGGAAAWVVSQAIDVTQPSGRFVWTVVPEEALEMTGSALFALALLVALRHGGERRSQLVRRLNRRSQRATRSITPRSARRRTIPA